MHRTFSLADQFNFVSQKEIKAVGRALRTFAAVCAANVAFALAHLLIIAPATTAMATAEGDDDDEWVALDL